MERIVEYTLRWRDDKMESYWVKSLYGTDLRTFGTIPNIYVMQYFFYMHNIIYNIDIFDLIIYLNLFFLILNGRPRKVFYRRQYIQIRVIVFVKFGENRDTCSLNKEWKSIGFFLSEIYVNRFFRINFNSPLLTICQLYLSDFLVKLRFVLGHFRGKEYCCV